MKGLYSQSRTVWLKCNQDMGCFKTCELSLKFIFKVWSNVIWTHGDLAFFLCLKFCQNLTLPLGGGIIIAITNVLLVIRFDCCFFIRDYFNYMILSLCDSVTMSDFIYSSLDKFPIMLEAKVLHGSCMCYRVNPVS